MRTALSGSAVLRDFLNRLHSVLVNCTEAEVKLHVLVYTGLPFTGVKYYYASGSSSVKVR